MAKIIFETDHPEEAQEVLSETLEAEISKVQYSLSLIEKRLQEYIDQFRRTLEKLQDFGLSEFFDFKQEIRPGKRAVINAKIVLSMKLFCISEHT